VTESDNLQIFYDASLNYNYNNCYYINPEKSRKTLTDKEKLESFLESFVLDPISELDSIVYKNAWQLMILFQDCGLKIHEKENVDIFHAINIRVMFNHIYTNYPTLDGGCLVRLSTILKEAKNKSKSSHRITRRQEKFALDVDILFLLMFAISVQSDAIDKYERSLSKNNDIVPKVRSKIMAIMTTVYQFYKDTLLEVMSK
jgi:hypothetical protein